MIEALDEEERLMLECFSLSLSSNGFGVSVDYKIVKDYTKRYKLETIEVLKVLKLMTKELGAKK